MGGTGTPTTETKPGVQGSGQNQELPANVFDKDIRTAQGNTAVDLLRLCALDTLPSTSIRMAIKVMDSAVTAASILSSPVLRSNLSKITALGAVDSTDEMIAGVPETEGKGSPTTNNANPDNSGRTAEPPPPPGIPGASDAPPALVRRTRTGPSVPFADVPLQNPQIPPSEPSTPPASVDQTGIDGSRGRPGNGNGNGTCPDGSCDGRGNGGGGRGGGIGGGGMGGLFGGGGGLGRLLMIGMTVLRVGLMIGLFSSMFRGGGLGGGMLPFLAMGSLLGGFGRGGFGGGGLFSPFGGYGGGGMPLMAGLGGMGGFGYPPAFGYGGYGGRNNGRNNGYGRPQIGPFGYPGAYGYGWPGLNTSGYSPYGYGYDTYNNYL